MASRRLLLARLAWLALSLAFLLLGLDQYGVLRALVRYLCPSCVGLS